MAPLQKSPELFELSAENREAVRLQMERLLASPHFRNSRRYTDLLRYVIQQTIDGHADVLKERTLGIEVFGREPNFDTSGDSIVRVAAAEVRKRLAQYYQEENHQQELRIDLPSGSYVPHFRYPQSQPTFPRRVLEPIAAPLPVPALGPARKRKLGLPAALIALAAVALGAAFWTWLAWPSAGDKLLGPFLQAPQDAMICIGVPQLAQNQPGAVGHEALALGEPTTNNAVVPFADALVLAHFQVWLNARHRATRVQLARNTTLNDLRSGPTILIGALDNPWTMRLTANLPFRFLGTDQAIGQIADSRAKSAKQWSVDFHVPYSDRTQDYAIVAITRDDLVDQPLLIAAGIGPNGTMAAGEFLLDPSHLDALARQAPHGWSGKNVEVVLATQVVQGNSGPPKVVATEYW
jgi:hypothetical protein